jgi:hypothetical protein
MYFVDDNSPVRSAEKCPPPCVVPVSDPDAEQAVIMRTHMTTQDARVNDETLLFMT